VAETLSSVSRSSVRRRSLPLVLIAAGSSLVVAACSGSSGGSSSSGSSSSGSSGSTSAVSSYAQCLQKAGQDLSKAQQCASLLNGK
jgi:hypothetical protein